MLFKNILILAAGLASMGVAAPISETETRGVANAYGAAHTLKMADDECRKRDVANAYGTAHALKMADDEYKRDVANAYGTAHALKMADDEYKA